VINIQSVKIKNSTFPKKKIVKKKKQEKLKNILQKIKIKNNKK